MVLGVDMVLKEQMLSTNTEMLLLVAQEISTWAKELQCTAEELGLDLFNKVQALAVLGVSLAETLDKLDDAAGTFSDLKYREFYNTSDYMTDHDWQNFEEIENV